MSDQTKEHNENPEWTKADFTQSRPAHELLSPDVLAAFPKTRGPQKSPKKTPVSIRLSPEVLDYYKSTGPGWQSRINEALKKSAGI